MPSFVSLARDEKLKAPLLPLSLSPSLSPSLPLSLSLSPSLSLSLSLRLCLCMTVERKIKLRAIIIYFAREPENIAALGNNC